MQKLDARLGARTKFIKSSTPRSDTELDKVSSPGIENREIDRVIGRTSRATGLRVYHTCLPSTVYAFVPMVHTQENQGSHRD